MEAPAKAQIGKQTSDGCSIKPLLKKEQLKISPRYNYIVKHCSSA